MAEVFRLPKLKTLDRIVDALGRPSISFVKFVNTDFAGSIERQEAKQLVTDERQDETDAALAATLAALEAAFAAIQSVNAVAQAAQQAANEAQTSADGGTTTSGSASGSVDVGTGSWQLGPQVDLTAAVVGDLLITGSGPQQDDSISAPNTITGDWRVVEIDGGTQTTVFTGTFTIYPGTPATVLNNSASAVAAFTLARTNSGAISYRIDAQRTDGGPDVADVTLPLYIYARRAA